MIELNVVIPATHPNALGYSKGQVTSVKTGERGSITVRIRIVGRKGVGGVTVPGIRDYATEYVAS